MKALKLRNILKVLFIAFSVAFLLTACSSTESGGTGTGQEDQRKAAEMQNTCWQSSFLKLFLQKYRHPNLNRLQQPD